MARNGSGIYSLPQSAFTPGSTISSAAVNNDFSDIADALTASIAADGQTTITGPIKFSSGNAAAPGITFGASITDGFFLNAVGQLGLTIGGLLRCLFTATGVTTSNGFVIGSPIGSVTDFAGTSAPAGWLLCYGQAVSRTTYSALFGVIATTYGAGDGINTFNLPDLRGRAIAGVDNMGGVAAGRLTSTYFGAAAALGAVGGLESNNVILTHTHNNTLTDPGHTHALPVSTGGFGGPVGGAIVSNSGGATSSSSTTGITINNASAGSAAAHNITQPTMELNKIIFAGV